jgi:hypothetical protein
VIGGRVITDVFMVNHPDMVFYGRNLMVLTKCVVTPESIGNRSLWRGEFLLIGLVFRREDVKEYLKEFVMFTKTHDDVLGRKARGNGEKFGRADNSDSVNSF